MPNHDDDRGKFEGRTYLYIRTHPLDDGTEPLPAGLPCWISPDIVIVKPDGTRGGEAVAGYVNQVEVTVTNDGGVQATDAYVEAFFANPATAITPASATAIGAGLLTTPGYTRAAIQFPWTPSAADAGHRCLIARVSLVLPPDSYRDPTVFDVVGDRHVAQRNISVLAGTGSTSSAAKRFSFRFQVAAAGRRGGEFTVRATPLKPGRQTDTVAAALGWQAVRFATSPAEVRLAIEKPAEEPAELDSEGFSVEDDRPEEPFGATPKPVELGAARSGKVRLKAGEIRVAVVTVSPSPETRPGEVGVVEVAQIDGRKRQVGGLWIVF
jgi:hypothetical protein